MCTGMDLVERAMRQRYIPHRCHGRVTDIFRRRIQRGGWLRVSSWRFDSALLYRGPIPSCIHCERRYCCPAAYIWHPVVKVASLAPPLSRLALVEWDCAVRSATNLSCRNNFHDPSKDISNEEKQPTRSSPGTPLHQQRRRLTICGRRAQERALSTTELR